MFAIEKEKQTELYMPDFEKTDGVMPLEKNSVPDESQSCRKLQNKNNSLREGIQSCLLRDIFLQRADGTRCSLEKLVSGYFRSPFYNVDARILFPNGSFVNILCRILSLFTYFFSCFVHFIESSCGHTLLHTKVLSLLSSFCVSRSIMQNAKRILY